MKNSDALAFLPSYLPDCFDVSGRMVRFLKSKSSGADDAAAQAEASRAQAQAQHEENMRNLRKQQRVAANTSRPEFSPASPPSSASVDIVEAGIEQRRKSQKRFGFSATVSATPMLGSMSTLGGGQ